MKKFSKILALALAVAMMLGMTAMAGTPSKILIQDDLSSVTDYASFQSGRTALTVTAPDVYTNTIGAVRPATDDGTLKYNAFYYGAFNVSTNNGQVKLVEAATSTKNNGLAYAPDAEFSFDDALNRKVALVSQVGWKVVAKTDKQVDLNFGRVLYKDASGTEKIVSNFALRGGYYAVDNLASDEILVIPNGGSEIETIKVGQETVLQVIIRPGTGNYDENVYNPEDILNKEEVEEEGAEPEAYGDKVKFLSYQTVDRGYRYTANFYKDLTRGSVQAFWLNGGSNAQEEYHDYVMYEVSLDPDDFYIENTTNTGKLTTDDFVITMSQPLSNGVGERYTTKKEDGTDNYDSLADHPEYRLVNSVVVSANGENLTVNEDYKVTLSEKIVGTAVKGIITITPLKNWSLGTTYTVTLPAETHTVARISKDVEQTATFTTIPAPVATFTAYEGLSDEGTAMADANYAGKTVYIKATATNSAAVAVNGKIVIGIYDANGLVKYASSTKALSATNGTATFGAAFKLAEGQTVRVEYR